MNQHRAMSFGAELRPEGGVRFRLWAPGAAHIDVELGDAATTTRRVRLRRAPDGWHEVIDGEAAAGTRYRYVTPDGLRVPDPASQWNPDGVHGASEVVDADAYEWRNTGWRGRPWHEAVLYELHVGTFTQEGTYAAAARRLEDLAALSITAIELMPLAAFAGRRGWGYDGVLPFAPHPAYGTPDELKAFVDRAHGLGLMVVLDVVYNHFGPDGNYLSTYCPQFFNAAHQTPWGAAINFDGDDSRTVRDFFVHNALFWVEQYRFDGLRLDAVHALRDDSELHICREIGQALRAVAARDGDTPRQLHLVLENDANTTSLLERDAAGQALVADAQWNDDLHHVAHVLATGETDGYYSDYASRPLERLGRALTEGFVYQGEASALRDGEPRGEPSAHLPSVAFVSFLQNHDQVGNRAFGERIDALAARRPDGARRLETIWAALLLAPQVPMLFMGEEFAASTPFLYFCDFEGELARAVSAGRRNEFKRFTAFEDEQARARIPDPNDERSFVASKLDWHEREHGSHADRLASVRHCLALRAEHLVPRLAHATIGGVRRVEGDLLQAEWVLSDGSLWCIVANLGERPIDVPLQGQLIHALRATQTRVLPDGLRVSLQSTRVDAGVASAAQEAEVEAADEPTADAVAAEVDPADARPATLTDAEPA